jgi:hypothetical protein
MRPNLDRQVAHAGTLVGENVRMGIDQNSIAHLMDVLTDLYSNPTLAVIREYSTNALDSHIAAGNPSPIEVTLPSAFASNFVVKDQGVGLSPDDLRDIYSKYGLSTKRGNNDEVGMLGLGCKSGLTYTNSFTIEAIKNGIKTIAVISRGEDGVGQIKIVDTGATTARNGVTVTVPVKDWYEFVRHANQFFRFWSPGTVLIDGKAPEFPEGVWLDQFTLITQAVDSCYIVMGGVPYRADKQTGRYSGKNENLCRHLPWEYHAVKWVKMGEVNFPPNRESLAFTPRTEAVIKRVQQEVKDQLAAKAQAEVSAAPTKAEALNRVAKWEPLVNANYTWKNQPLPAFFKTPGAFIWNINQRWGRTKTEAVSEVPRQSLANLVQVVGFTAKAVTTTHRSRVRQYCDDNNIAVDGRSTAILFTENKVGGEWFTDDKVVNYSDLKAVRTTTAGGGTRKIGPTTYRMWDGTEWSDAYIEDIEGDDVILYSPAQAKRKRRWDNELDVSALKEFFSTSVIVRANKNSWDKIRREVPEARTVQEAVEAASKQFIADITEDEVFAIAGGRTYTHGALRALDADKVLDPEVKKAVGIVKGDGLLGKRGAYHLLATLRRGLGLVSLKLPESKTAERLNAVVDNYPLMKDNYKGRDVLEYVNAVYEYRNK